MNAVRVRMYRQGLGDCFLLSFPRPGGDQSHVLIDCGVLTGSADAAARMGRVAESIFKTTGGRLDALVVTHQHWDHVSGFLQAEDVFNRLDVAEVWLAWTEDPSDELASELAHRRRKAVAAVERAAMRLSGAAESSARHTVQALNGLLAFHGELGANSRATTATAIAWVKSRQNARVRYFTPGCDPVQVPGVDDARVYVLGPPRDAKLLRKSDPSARSSEVYELAGLSGEDLGFLAALETAPDEGDSAGAPFDPWFRISDAEAWNLDFFGEHYGFEGEDDQGWRRIEHDWVETASRLALQLDSHTNNTSLALAFELDPSRRVLLFPGDAQVGNWMSWSGREWNVQTESATRRVTTADLLARTVLYKVSHHGSHNATLRELGLELMTSRELAAMLPVDRTTARKMDWNMPFPTLYRRLHEKTGGRLLDLETGLPPTPPEQSDPGEWDRFIARTDVTPDWIDYRVEL
jgi:Metallo-beta-lactamase superfamily